MTDIGSCKTCRYFDSKDWDSETKNWCRYNDLPANDEGLCGHFEPIIRPCPFCGCTNVIVDEFWERYDKPYFVACDGCGASGPYTRKKEEAIDLWNKRVNE